MMISLTNLKFNKTNFCGLQYRKNANQVFMGSGEDVFVKSTESKDMKDNLYVQRNIAIDMDDIRKKYAEKTSILPLIMDRVMKSAGSYIEQKDEAKSFSQKFLDGASSLATRISIGSDSEEYQKCYEPELHFIKKVSPLCDNFYNNQLPKESFDSGVEECVVDYVNDKTVRSKHFIK